MWKISLLFFAVVYYICFIGCVRFLGSETQKLRTENLHFENLLDATFVLIFVYVLSLFRVCCRSYSRILFLCNIRVQIVIHKSV